MANLILSINLTLDGCCDHTIAVADGDHHQYAMELLDGATALLFGRNTYDLFESHWPAVAEKGTGTRSEVEFARALETKPKYVLSRRRKKLTWGDSTLLAGELAEVIDELKQETRGNLVMFGSPGLARDLAELDAIDEFHFLVQPVVAGNGPTFMEGISRRVDLAHLGTRWFRSGVLLNRYRTVSPI